MKNMAVYTRVFCVRFSVRDGGAAHQFPLLFTCVIAREKQRKLVGSGAITAEKRTQKTRV
jgi:hypothetical protein